MPKPSAVKKLLEHNSYKVEADVQTRGMWDVFELPSESDPEGAEELIKGGILGSAEEVENLFKLAYPEKRTQIRPFKTRLSGVSARKILEDLR